MRDIRIRPDGMMELRKRAIPDGDDTSARPDKATNLLTRQANKQSEERPRTRERLN